MGENAWKFSRHNFRNDEKAIKGLREFFKSNKLTAANLEEFRAK